MFRFPWETQNGDIGFSHRLRYTRRRIRKSEIVTISREFRDSFSLRISHGPPRNIRNACRLFRRSDHRIPGRWPILTNMFYHPRVARFCPGTIPRQFCQSPFAEPWRLRNSLCNCLMYSYTNGRIEFDPPFFGISNKCGLKQQSKSETRISKS